MAERMPQMAARRANLKAWAKTKLERRRSTSGSNISNHSNAVKSLRIRSMCRVVVEEIEALDPMFAE